MLRNILFVLTLSITQHLAVYVKCYLLVIVVVFVAAVVVVVVVYVNIFVVFIYHIIKVRSHCPCLFFKLCAVHVLISFSSANNL